jgi:hypothetical protein
MLDLHAFLPTLELEVQKAFLSYIEYGYKHVEAKIESSKALGTYLNSRFLAAAIGREISISYFSKGKSEHGTLVVHIRNRNVDSFEVADGMRQKGAPEDEILRLSLHTLTGTTQERIGLALAAARMGLDKYMLEVVQGKEWFQVPINWGNSR